MGKRFVKRSAKRRNGRRKFAAKRRSGASKGFVRKVGRAIGQLAEKKFIDFSSGAVSINNASGIQNILVAIPLGTGNGARIGTQIKIRSITVRGNSQVVSAYPQTYIRCIGGMWNDYWVTTPTGGQLVNNVADQWNTFTLRQNLEGKKWRQLWDTRFQQVYTDPTTSRTRPFEFKLFGKRLPVKTIEYNSAGNPNVMYFFYMWSGDVGAGPFNAMTYNVRVTYTDV